MDHTTQHTFDLIPGGRANRTQNPTPPDSLGELGDIFQMLQAIQVRIVDLMDTPEPEDQIGKLRVAKLRSGLGVPLEQITDAVQQLSTLIPQDGINLDDVEEIEF